MQEGGGSTADGSCAALGRESAFGRADVWTLTRRQLDRLEVSHGVIVALSASFSRNSVSLSYNQQLQCFGFFFQTSERGQKDNHSPTIIIYILEASLPTLK